MEELNVKLKNFQRKQSIFSTFTILFFVGTIAVFIVAGAWGFACIAPLAASVLALSSVQKKYKAFFAENVIDICVKDCDFVSDLSFDASSGIPYGTVAATGMIKTGDAIETKNLVTGEVHGTAFARSDVRITETTLNADNTHSTSTVFAGKWICFRLDRDLHTDIQAVSKKFRAAIQPRGFAQLSDMPDCVVGEKRFSEVFKLYSNEQALPTEITSLPSVIMSIYNSVKAPLMIMLIGDTAHIVIAGATSVFDPTSGGRKDIEGFRNGIFKELHSITNMIELLNY